MPDLGFRSGSRPSSSMAFGESRGVDVPESGSFLPRNPLCNRVLGAGNPLRKCSSSASVPLSLAWFELCGDVEEGWVCDRATVAARCMSRSEGSRSSKL